MVADRGPVTSAVTILFVCLCTVFVAARFYTRIWLVRRVKRDDYLILVAWILSVGFSASICVGTHYGLGLHSSDIRPDRFPALRKAQYTFSVLYNPCLMLTKTSIIVFYLSVMSKDVDPVFKWSNWLTLAVTNIAGLALTFLNLFQCTPVASGFMYPTPPTAQCIDIVTLYLSSAPVNIITDLAILFLPMPILTRLQLPKKQKIILLVTFSFGAFVAVVDVIRIAYLQNAALNRLQVVQGSGGQQPRTVEAEDFPWYASLSFMWSAVEVNLGIICACVPSLKPLFSRFLPTFIRDAGEEFSPTNSMQLTTKTSAETDPGRVPTAESMLSNPAAFHKANVKEYSGDDDGDEMGFLNMLAGPDDEAPAPRPQSAPRSLNLATAKTNQSTASDFDFVRMDDTKNMLKLSNGQSIWPVAVVTVIFFLWGFAYGLLDTLNAQFQKVVKLSGNESLGLHAAYFGGYFFGPLTLGRFILKRYGFKAAMMAGLCVYGCGTLVFWPAAVLTSYTAFVISNFIVAFGLSCLEIAANPYIAICGPLEYAEVRLNFSQGFQAIGTVVSPLLATKVLFKNVLSAPSLVDVQWTYLGIALFVIGLAVVFYYIRLPEATDEQLQAMADRRSAVYGTKIGSVYVVWITLALGVFSQWCYVGGQESIAGNTEALVTLLRPRSHLASFDFSTIGHSVFAAGRFLFAFLNYVVKPRWILLILYTGLLVTCGLQMGLQGSAGVGIDMLIYFFESGIFSVIFAISLRGMGSHTKTASAFMTAAISGGAIPPVLQWAVANARGLRYSYCIPLAFFAFGAIFPLYLNLFPAARRQVDPTHEDRRRRQQQRRLRHESMATNPTSHEFGLTGILARRKQQKDADTTTGTSKHIERQSQPGTPIMLGLDEKIIPPVRSPSPTHRKRPSRQTSRFTSWRNTNPLARASTSSTHDDDDDDDDDAATIDRDLSPLNEKSASHPIAIERDFAAEPQHGSVDIPPLQSPAEAEEISRIGEDGYDDYHRMLKEL